MGTVRQRRPPVATNRSHTPPTPGPIFPRAVAGEQYLALREVRVGPRTALADLPLGARDERSEHGHGRAASSCARWRASISIAT